MRSEVRLSSMNYISYKNHMASIKVFTPGQSKVAQPRRGYLFTSNACFRTVLWMMQGDADSFRGEADNGFLPFICCLNDKAQVHHPENWQMANPSLPYLPELYAEVEDEYREWLEHPEQNGDFMTKRMGIRIRL